MDDVVLVLAIICAAGSGLVAGAFFAFSTFVMGALSRIRAEAGMSAMQSINIVVINPLFMGAFLGTVVACLALAVLSAIDWNEPEVFYHIAGATAYVVGCFGVTIAFNVPRNDRLATMEPSAKPSEEYWKTYVQEWTFWNHVRTFASLVAMVLLVVAISES